MTSLWFGSVGRGLPSALRVHRGNWLQSGPTSSARTQHCLNNPRVAHGLFRLRGDHPGVGSSAALFGDYLIARGDLESANIPQERYQAHGETAWLPSPSTARYALSGQFVSTVLSPDLFEEAATSRRDLHYFAPWPTKSPRTWHALALRAGDSWT